MKTIGSLSRSLFTLIITLFVSILFYNRVHAKSNSTETIDSIKLPKVRSYILDNGLRTLYIKNEMPELLITASIGFGRLYENKDNAGISELLAKTLTLGGSKDYQGQSLHKRIESIGGIISIRSSWEEIVITLRVLERYADTAFDILSSIIMNPNIEKKFTQKAKSILMESVRRKKDSPDALVFEKLREIIFDGNGYGSVMSQETLDRITKNDLVRIWKKYINSKNIILGISTSIEFSRIKNYVKNHFSISQEGNVHDYAINISSIHLSMKDKAKNIYLIPKNIPQATIAIGTIAPAVKDEIIYPLRVMNYILGEGSFNSRLMKEIRVKRGLSYAVQSVIRFRKNTGVFIAYAQTKNETTDSVLFLLLGAIDRISKTKVTNNELRWAKNSIRNSFIFEFETPFDILNKYLFLSYNELSENYLLDYTKNIDNVSKKIILGTSKDLFENGLVKVVVGKKDLKELLTRFGNVIIVQH